MGLAGRLYAAQVPLERNAVRAAAELARPLPGERALDLATGTGAMPRALAARQPDLGELTGVDSSRSMLAAARLPPFARAVVGDVLALPFPDRGFHLVTAAYLLHLLDPGGRRRTLAEAARVLRPGGRIVTVTVASRRAASRAALERLPRCSGLRALDPRPELGQAGLVPVCGRFVNRGWPSLVVRAERPRRKAQGAL